jgi:transcriptional regulator with XRE-family HTH domain
MAAALYVDRVTVSQWEKGARDIKTGNMVSLAEYLGVSCDYLLGRSRTAAPDDFVQEVCKRYGLTEGTLATLEWLAAPAQFSSEVSERIIEKQRRYEREIVGLIRALPDGQEATLDDIPPIFDAVTLPNENKLTAHEYYILSQKIQDDINRSNLQALNELLTVSTKRAIEGGTEGETYGLVMLHAVYSYCHKEYKAIAAYNEEWGTTEKTPAETLRAANLALITRYCTEFSEALKADKVSTPETIRATKRTEQIKNAIKLQQQEVNNGKS